MCRYALFSLAWLHLKLNPQKCRFCCSEVEYLGHIVTPRRVKPNVNNLEAVKEFPVQITLKELRHFFGVSITLLSIC